MLIGFDGLVDMVQALREFAEDLPFRRRFLVVDRLLFRLGHFRTPDGVHAQILVEDHEQVIQPPLTESLVAELGIRRLGNVRLFNG